MKIVIVALALVATIGSSSATAFAGQRIALHNASNICVKVDLWRVAVSRIGEGRHYTRTAGPITELARPGHTAVFNYSWDGQPYFVLDVHHMVDAECSRTSGSVQQLARKSPSQPFDVNFSGTPPHTELYWR